jgi:hypothetical protein
MPIQETKTKEVFIIEDELEDYKEVFKVFENNGWTAHPSPEEYIDIWEEIYKKSTKQKLWEHICDYLKQNHPRIGAIILDIRLKMSDEKDRTGRDYILTKLRNNDVGENKYKNWGKKIPIIGLTRIKTDEIARSLLVENDHIDAFFHKQHFVKNPDLLVFTAESLYSTFQLRLGEGAFDVMRERLEVIYEHLAKRGEAILSRIDDVDIIIKGGFNSTKSKLNLILNATIKQMSDDDIEVFISEFSNELKDALGNEKFEKMKRKIDKPTLKEMFKKSIKSGNVAEFSQFMLNIYDEYFKESTEKWVPAGKFIGLGITSILKILSK